MACSSAIRPASNRSRRSSSADPGRADSATAREHYRVPQRHRVPVRTDPVTLALLGDDQLPALGIVEAEVRAFGCRSREEPLRRGLVSRSAASKRMRSGVSPCAAAAARPRATALGEISTPSTRHPCAASQIASPPSPHPRSRTLLRDSSPPVCDTGLHDQRQPARRPRERSSRRSRRASPGSRSRRTLLPGESRTRSERSYGTSRLEPQATPASEQRYATRRSPDNWSENPTTGVRRLDRSVRIGQLECPMTVNL